MRRSAEYHADVLIQGSPADLEYFDEVVMNENVARLARPVLETEIADRNGGVRGFVGEKRSRLDRHASHECVAKEGELGAPR